MVIKSSIKTVGIVAKPKIENIKEILEELSIWFGKMNVTVNFDRQSFEVLDGARTAYERKSLPAKVDLIVVLGGDGTILSIGTAAAEAGVPVLGINMGGLGFLAETTREEMYETLELVITGDFKYSERLMLHCELQRGEETKFIFEALNDVVINKAAIARMIEIEVFLDGQFVIHFRADGLIVATPTGSTAYALSAGGPIMSPGLKAFIIAPICPHTLTYRPLVVGSESVVELVNYAEKGAALLTIDGQQAVELERLDKITVRRSTNALKLIGSYKKSHFQILNEKLQWGKM